MVRLIVFGKFLAKNFREDRVPPLSELQWHVVQQAIDAWTESTTHELVYGFNCIIQDPTTWFNGYGDASPTPEASLYSSQSSNKRNQRLYASGFCSQKPTSTAKTMMKRSQIVTRNNSSSHRKPKMSKRPSTSQSLSNMTSHKAIVP